MPESPMAESPLARLLTIMARLRDPNTGCEWDRAQDFGTIAPYTIEEAYEVADAIARHDMHDLRDELGDLLFQVVFHARMAEEIGAFAFDDVAAAISDKMERRHPHIFVAEHSGDADGVRPDWEALKAAERSEKSQGVDNGDGALAGVALGLPALLRAEKLQKRAARVGFDWPSSKGAADKLREEIAEFDAAETAEDRFEEAGDLLFSVVNLLRKTGIDAEAALRAANAKFEGRFATMEHLARKSGLRFADLDLDRQETLWGEAKKTER